MTKPYIAAGFQGTGYIAAARLDDGQLAPITSFPNGNGNGCAFSPDGSLLAVAHNSSPFITIYSTSDWSRLPNPSQLPSGNGNGCAFSPDGSLLAVAHSGSPTITIYNTSDWSKLPNPGQLPNNTGNGCAFSPDGSLLAVAHNISPTITIYNTSDWSKLPNPSQLPGGTVYGCAFSPDGSLLAVAHFNSPYITIYNTSDWSASEKLGNLVSAVATASTQGRSVAFHSPPRRYLRGTVRDKDGNPAARQVRAHRRSDGLPVAETISDALTGDYELELYGAFDTEYDVQFMAAPGEALNDLFFARATTSED